MEHNRKTILYVDDILYNLVKVKERLKPGYEVSIAQSVEKMFKILEHFHEIKQANPDLILLDIKVPEMDGFEAIKELKNEERYSKIPIIVLSSKHDKNTMITAMILGAADFVAKPFSDSCLIERIEYQLDSDKYNIDKQVIHAVDDNIRAQ